MAFAMVAVFSLAFVSCGDDDEDDNPSTSGYKIEINGKLYEINPNQFFGVVWNKIPVGCVIQFDTGKNMYSDDGEVYTFGFVACDQENNYDEPKVGMDITKLGRRIMTDDEDIWGKLSLTDDDDIECDYISGSLIVTEIDKKKETITLKFSNLKMGKGKTSYTFNGTLKLPFDLWV